MTTSPTSRLFLILGVWMLSFSKSHAFAMSGIPTRVQSGMQRLFGTAASNEVAGLAGRVTVPVKEAISLHSSPNVKFIDGSWFLFDRNAREEFVKGPRIQGAQFFDIDDIATPANIPHMMPPKKLFESAMDAMGITNSDHIIVYGTNGCPLMHRTWFQIRSMGHGSANTHLMDGSLDDWAAAGGPIEEGPPTHPVISAKDLPLDKPTSYQATEPQNVVDKEEILKVIQQGDDADAVLVDVRAPARHRGEVEEPRKGLRLGRMPGSKNLFFVNLLEKDNLLKYKPLEEIKNVIAEGDLDIDTSKRIIIHCGSGASACVLSAALDMCGRDPSKTFVYDASWMEWGGSLDTPIEKDGKITP
eukprot:Nitzschia sp. Nitz4//scaffold222_size33694//23706//24876//NITZ4_007865-RA/size33694-augustus-gene-0.24-mRNA-1//-1//CDS//3329542600//3039//frame0